MLACAECDDLAFFFFVLLCRLVLVAIGPKGGSTPLMTVLRPAALAMMMECNTVRSCLRHSVDYPKCPGFFRVYSGSRASYSTSEGVHTSIALVSVELSHFVWEKLMFVY